MDRDEGATGWRTLETSQAGPDQGQGAESGAAAVTIQRQWRLDSAGFSPL